MSQLCVYFQQKMSAQVKSEAGPEVRISQPAVRYSVPSGRAGAEQGMAPTQASLPIPAQVSLRAVTDVRED